ncbi:MAG TPA: hypothetical protein PK626_00395 [Bacteroidales bacterium]|nr:hypothetical protein [Bacteroidales bacterium]
MIKTSELMLGDFIHLTDGQIAQVIAIDILGNIDVEFVEEGVLNRIRAHEEDIHPIRLSEYFFLINGFTRQFHSADKIDYFIQDFVISRDGFNDFWFHIGNDKYIMINYIHQFQHILKSLKIYDISEKLKI